VTKLTVLYDARCGLCCAVRDWLSRQHQLVPLEFRPKPDAVDEMVVEADSGEIWEGDSAWIVILWALANYRAAAYRLASPALLPLARGVFARVSGYRGAISCQLGLTPEATAS
jgi:predicted DCC family thiol-disulfide oxidoreductase YuxK